MAYVEKQRIWFFVKSVAVVAILLYPFYYVGGLVIAGIIRIEQIKYLVDTMFGPATWFLNILCASAGYCVTRHYHGAAVMGPIYLVSVLLYGYVISLIWSWVAISPQGAARRRNYQTYHEHDEFF